MYTPTMAIGRTEMTRVSFILVSNMQQPAKHGGLLPLASRLLSLWLVVLIGLFNFSVAYAAAGDLDPSFGSGGEVTTDFGDSDEVHAITLQPDDKILVTGSSSSFASNFSGFYLARYHTHGALDATFGNGGKASIIFLGSDIPYSLVVQPNGKIIVGGSASVGGLLSTPPSGVIARLDNNGALDTTFGDGGKVNISELHRVTAIVLQEDGKILITGPSKPPSITSLPDFVLLCYNYNGTLDNSFGVGGKITTDFSGGSDFSNGLALQPDGKILVTGWTLASGTSRAALVRYLSGGSLDGDFGNDGKVVADFGWTSASAITLQPDGKIIIVGSITTPNSSGFSSSDFLLLRYQSQGTLDTGFGDGGKVSFDFVGLDDSATAVFVQPDGKIVAGGFLAQLGPMGVPPPCGLNLPVGFVRLNLNGSPDTVFGNQGKVGPSWTSLSFAMTHSEDGKITIAGSECVEGRNDFALARYLGDSGLPQPGWWWNPNESGRGFSIEVSQNTLVMAGYLYDTSGRATWYTSAGPMANNTLYQGTLQSFGNGQTLTGHTNPIR